MKDRQQTIMELLDGYETIVKKAKDAGFITTKNFLGDIVETLSAAKLMLTNVTLLKKDLTP